MFAPLAAVALSLAAAGPLSTVKNADVEIQKVLAGPDASVSTLAARADEFVDFAELARRAMGEQWSKLNKKQQDEFTDTMRGLLRASYAQKAVSEGRGGGTKIEYGAEKVEGNEATVPTTLVVKQDRFPVIYKLYRPTEKASWRVYDVITDDVSLVSTYADQFRSVISKSGVDALIKKLKDKRDSLERQNAEKAKN